MSRLHPFDVLRAALSEDWFSEIRAIEAQGRDPADRLQFHELGAVQRVLRELHPPEPAGPGTTIAEYQTLLYATYRYWRAGRHTFALAQEALVGDSTARGLDGSRAPRPGESGSQPAIQSSSRRTSAPPNRPPAVPHGACYIQLPERLFWAKIDETAAPEPMDGMFLAMGPGDQEITVLAVLGLRPERGGFSQIAMTVPPGDLVRAGSFARRPLFAPVLEGGDRAGVKSLVSDAELLHLAHLALTEVAR
jgi:hypothetical protein